MGLLKIPAGNYDKNGSVILMTLFAIRVLSIK